MKKKKKTLGQEDYSGVGIPQPHLIPQIQVGNY